MNTQRPNTRARAMCAKAEERYKRGDGEASIALFAKAAKDAPADPVVQLVYAMALRRDKRFSDSLEPLGRGLAVAPDDFELASQRADSLRMLNQHQEALREFNDITRRFPDRADAWANLAGMLIATGHPTHALGAAHRALELDARNHRALCNAAEALKEIGEWDAALGMLNTACEVRPDDAVVRFNRSILLLQLGQWAEGWQEHEWRRQVPGIQLGCDTLDSPVWQGDDLTGRHIVWNPEQGLGDEVMLARFVADLADRGATVTVRCYGPLVRLFASLRGVSRVISRSDPIPAHDYHIDGFSLPGVLGYGRPDTLSGAPYLSPAGSCPPAIAAALPAGEFSVGLVWTGNPQQVLNGRRTVPPAAVARLLDVPGVRFVSLQKHLGAEHPGLPPEFGARVTDLAPLLGDMNDTAHAMKRLGLVITMCSSPVHVAGALGVPAWVLLGHTADWRWLVGTDRSPWYESVRLFRQDVPFQWDGVIGRVRSALQAMAHEAVGA